MPQTSRWNNESYWSGLGLIHGVHARNMYMHMYTYTCTLYVVMHGEIHVCAISLTVFLLVSSPWVPTDCRPDPAFGCSHAFSSWPRPSICVHTRSPPPPWVTMTPVLQRQTCSPDDPVWAVGICIHHKWFVEWGGNFETDIYELFEITLVWRLESHYMIGLVIIAAEIMPSLNG